MATALNTWSGKKQFRYEFDRTTFDRIARVGE
jgi:hypothetical protein